MTSSVGLHDVEGQYLESIDIDVPRDTAIQHNGRLYVWNQRNGHYREMPSTSTAVPIDEFDRPRSDRAKAMLADARTAPAVSPE